MNNKDQYLEIYYYCLNKDYFDKSIEPLLHNLYGLVICYEEGIKEGKYTKPFMDDDSIDNLRVEFISKLIKIFKKIINDNNQNKVYNACRLLLASKKNVSSIPYGLKVIFYPQDAYREDTDQYYQVIEDIIYWYSNNDDSKLYYFESIDKNLKEILLLYKDYLTKVPYKNKDEIYKEISFNNYMKIVIAYFHKEKYDINIFPKVLDYVFQNIDYLDDFVEMNNYNNQNNSNNEEYICNMLVKRIMEGSTKNNRIIK